MVDLLLQEVEKRCSSDVKDKELGSHSQCFLPGFCGAVLEPTKDWPTSVMFTSRIWKACKHGNWISVERFVGEHYDGEEIVSDLRGSNFFICD